MRVRRSSRARAVLALVLALGLAASGLTGCASRAAGPHWPRSAGAIVPDDPADDGGESLEPRAQGEGAAAVEHGGEDITEILDDAEPAAAEPAAETPAAAGPTAAAPPAPDDATDGTPTFEEVIIVN